MEIWKQETVSDNKPKYIVRKNLKLFMFNKRIKKLILFFPKSYVDVYNQICQKM